MKTDSLAHFQSPLTINIRGEFEKLVFKICQHLVKNITKKVNILRLNEMLRSHARR